MYKFNTFPNFYFVFCFVNSIFFLFKWPIKTNRNRKLYSNKKVKNLKFLTHLGAFLTSLSFVRHFSINFYTLLFVLDSWTLGLLDYFWFVVFFIRLHKLHDCFYNLYFFPLLLKTTATKLLSPPQFSITSFL